MVRSEGRHKRQDGKKGGKDKGPRIKRASWSMSALRSISGAVFGPPGEPFFLWCSAALTDDLLLSSSSAFAVRVFSYLRTAAVSCLSLFSC